MKRNINTMKLVIVSSFIILLIFFFVFAYKKIKSGNNESNKSAEEVQEYISNINSYTAEIEVTVNSNKNKNKYLIRQEYSKDKISKQTILKPENIEGVEFEFKDNSLTLNNSKLNISKVYNDYPYIADNVLWLNSYGESLKESTKKNIYEENDEIIMEVKIKNNKYFATKKLYVQSGTGKPIKMEVFDSNNNCVIYILYKEISINN